MENFIKLIFKTIFSISLCFLSLNANETKSSEPEIDYKRALKEQGIDFSGSVVYHLDANLKGGIKTGVINQGLIDLGLLFHSEKILHYPGGELFVNFEAHVGKNPSFDLVGDIIFFDLISAPDFVQASEFWYKQKIQGFSLKVGRVSTVLDLAITDNALIFINNAFEAIPTIAGYPTYPAPVPGAIIRYDHNESLALKLGLFNGEEALFSFEKVYPFGVWSDFFKNLLVMTEVDIHFFNKQARLAAGLTYNNTEIFLSSGEPEKIKYSGYLIGEYNLYDKYCCFLQWGIGDPKILIFPYYLGFGVDIKKFLPIEMENDLGLAFTSNFFSKKIPQETGIRGAEMVLEATYVLKWGSLSLQPDFQYIINPGGASLPNALAFVLNVEITL